MNTFCPDIQTKLIIKRDTYRFLPHPVLPDEVNKIVRINTTTYQLQKEADKTLWALKVPNPGAVDPSIEQKVSRQSSFGHLPGLSAANRICLLKTVFPELIATHPSLEYAILMPWISGRTWAGFMDDGELCSQYSLERAKELALTMAYVLWSLETNGLAHTDIAGDNVIIVNYKHVELIDLEGMYVKGTPPVAQPSKGWAGYQHPRLDGQGQSYLLGDRFAGAILLVEMLTWWNPLIRALTDGESLFQFKHPGAREEMTQRLRAVRQTLRSMYPGLHELFEQAWYSSNLSRCPDFRSWVMCLLRLRWDG
ncbi:serine/threonine protein kinase [Dictyobacter formicarum]|uniref:Protein kinase domain-containing protein n=1 Tax=Dictyobacter formicarum TaxID=2778368 RepID=A0ABQ3VQC1_9CHLR|nr:serine/threonine protein kinase [Dictyobacter formicarum]GHO87904.1 hypothetical protein KSZ_59100 [Dictyobacter formicarum]